MIKSYNLCSTFWHKVLENCPVPFFGFIVCPSVIHCTFLEDFLSHSLCKFKQRQIYLLNFLSLSKFICPFPHHTIRTCGRWPNLVVPNFISSSDPLPPPSGSSPGPVRWDQPPNRQPREEQHNTLFHTFFPLSKSQKSEHIVTSKRSTV